MLGYTMYVLTAIIGWDEEDAWALTTHMRAQFNKSGVNSWLPRRVVWGRKPW